MWPWERAQPQATLTWEEGVRPVLAQGREEAIGGALEVFPSEGLRCHSSQNLFSGWRKGVVRETCDLGEELTVSPALLCHQPGCWARRP